MAPVTPTLLALLLCDSIIVDETSKKKTLVGIFTRIRTRTIPCLHQSMGLYFSLTNAEGDYDILIKLSHLDPEAQIAEINIKATFKDILGISDVGITMPPLNLKESGRYEFQLIANGNFLGRREFLLEKVEEVTL